LQWLQFAADPMPWWTEADLSTVAQYCAALDVLEAARGGKAYAWAAASREVRALADALGLTPMARARMGLRKPKAGGGRGGDDAGRDGSPAPVIPIDELLDGGSA
jgi:phage terminase small subunit